MSLIFVWSVHQTAVANHQAELAVQATQQEVQSLEQLQAEQAEKAKAAADPFTKEKIIRDELLLQKTDETVVQLPAMPTATPGQQVLSPTATPLRLWQEKLWLK